MSAQVTKLSTIEKDLLKRFQKGKKFSISSELKDELQIKIEGEILFDEPMSKHTYIKIGGKADVYITPASKESLVKVLQIAKENNIPFLFHGTGANTLVRDGGIRGFVISSYNALNNYSIVEDTEEYVDLYAESGVNFNQLVKFSKTIPSLDLASFIGIPGSVGGLVKMNAGTREKEIKDVLRSITIINKDLNEQTISREKLDLEYRNLKMPKQNFILGATFRLYKNVETSEEVEEKTRFYQEKRTNTQPLNYPNLGSIFKNPIHIKGFENISAGKLIEEAGLKGVRVGDARISSKHANFIINEGNASANDVAALINLAKDKVKMIHGIELETEWKIIGEDNK